MKNAVLGILSILLAAALVFTGVLYSKNSGRQTLLAEREDEITRLEKEQRQLKSDSEELQKKLDRCETALDDEQARPDLESDINQALMEKEEAFRALAEKETALHQLEQKLQNMENFIDSLQGKLSNSQSCISTLQTDLLGYKRDLATQSLKTSQKKIDQLEEEVVKFQAELLVMLQKTTSPDVIESLKDDIRARQAEIDRLKAAGQMEAPGRIMDLEGRLTQCQTMIDRLQKEAADVDITGLKATIESCRTELAQVKQAGTDAELKAVASKIAECRQELDQFKSAGLDKQIMDLEKAISACQGNLLALQGRGDKNRIEQLEVEIKTCRTELDALRGVEPCQPQTALEDELARYKQALEAGRRTDDARIKALEGTIASYEQELERAQKEGADKKNQNLISDLKGKIDVCRGELAGLKADRSRLDAQACQAEVVELKEALKSFKESFPEARIKYLESEIQRLEAQLKESAGQGSESLIANLNEQIAGCRNELEGLRLLQQQKADGGGLPEKMAEMERELNILREACPPESRIAFLESEINRLKDELGRSRKTGPTPLIENLEQKIARCQTELEDLQKGEKGGGGVVTVNGETKRRTIASLEEELAALKKKKAEVEASLQQLRGARESLSKLLGKQMQDQSITITAQPRHGDFSLDVVDRVLFDSGRATITAQGREVLTKVGAALKGVQNRRILVVGHTDNVPISGELRHRFDSNWELSAARAVAVARFFQNQCGLSPEHLEAVARSFYSPRASNDTEAGRAQNRRVEIVFGSSLF